MWQISSGRIPKPVRKIVIGGAATIAVSALGVTLMLPTRDSVGAQWVDVAAIDQSSSTLGFADSDLYGMTPAQIDQSLDQMQAMGVNNVRIMVPWAGVEYYPNTYNWSTVDYMVQAADSRGMGILANINATPFWAVTPGTPAIAGAPADPAQYGAFASAVAQRYAGKIGGYEIWNEPNAASSYAPQPDPTGYTALLKAAYPAIKAADPNAVVVGGVTGSVIDYGNLTMNPVKFVNGIYQAGGEGYFDALSFHPYQFTTPFSQGGPLPESPINQLDAMHQVMVANGDGSKLIWASEYGEPSNVAGEQNQADYLNDMISKWRTLGYTGPTFVWTLQDRNTGSTDPEDNFGVIRTDGTWKPAAYTIQQLANQPQAVQLAAAVSRMAMTPTDPTAVTVAPTDPTAIPTTLPAPTNPMEAVMDVAAMALQNFGQAAAAALAQATGAAVPATTPATVTDAATTASSLTAAQTPAQQAVTGTTAATAATDATTSTTAQIARQAEQIAQQATQTEATTAAAAATPATAVTAPVATAAAAKAATAAATPSNTATSAATPATAAATATAATAATPATAAKPATPAATDATAATTTDASASQDASSAGEQRAAQRQQRQAQRQQAAAQKQATPKQAQGGSARADRPSRNGGGK